MFDKPKDPSKIYSLDYSSSHLTDIPENKKYMNCKCLDVLYNKITLLNVQSFLPYKQLKELKISSNNLETVEGISALSHLEELHLQHNKLKDTKCLRGLKNLRVLRLDCNQISNINPDDLAGFSKLTHLDVSANKLTKDIRWANSLHSLIELNCSSNMLARIADVHSLINLKELDASSNNITSVELKSLKDFATLVLDNNHLQDLTELHQHTSLLDLRLSNNKISQTKHIVDCFPNLEVLHISGNKISKLSEIERLVVLKDSLSELCIHDNPVTLHCEDHSVCYSILKSLKLDVLDRTVFSPQPFKMMRPLSAGQMISFRHLENEMRRSDMRVRESLKKIDESFDDIYEQLQRVTTVERPSSCSRRVRLAEAKSFADEVVYMMEDRLVWVDLEMTGLNVSKDHIIEMVCVITDKDLNIIAQSPDVVIKQPDVVLDTMDDWCKKHHKESGLTKAVKNSQTSLQECEQQMVRFIKKHTLKGRGYLAGNSVHVDKEFLKQHMPDFVSHLHYRIVDVSSVKVLCAFWCPGIMAAAPKKNFCHRAKDDIMESIEELRYYRAYLFVK